MKKILILAIICCFLTSCGLLKRERTMDSLSEVETEKLNQLVLQRKNCIIDQINQLDNNTGGVKEVSELVTWKCSSYINRMMELLYKDFGIGLGKAYVFTNNLQNNTNNEVTEAIMAKRGIKKDEPVGEIKGSNNFGGDNFNYPQPAQPPSAASLQPIPQGTMPPMQPVAPTQPLQPSMPSQQDVHLPQPQQQQVAPPQQQPSPSYPSPDAESGRRRPSDQPF